MTGNLSPRMFPVNSAGFFMANQKITSFLYHMGYRPIADLEVAVEEMKKQNIDDIKTAIDVIDQEIGRLEGYIDQLRERVVVLEGGLSPNA